MTTPTAQSAYLTMALEAAQAGGKIAMQHFYDPPNVRTKEMSASEHKSSVGGGSTWTEVVSDVDISVEKAIKIKLLTAFPEHSFRGEETEDVNGKSVYTWYTDPLSCTANYLKRAPHFSICIALVEEEIPILGISFDPYYNELFYAERDGGAFMNDKPINVSDHTDFETALGSLKTMPVTQLQGFSPHRNRVLGSTGLHYALTAAGRIDFTISKHTDLYAELGPCVIVQEAGGTVTDFEGKPLSIKSKNIVGSNGKLHNKILAALTN